VADPPGQHSTGRRGPPPEDERLRRDRIARQLKSLGFSSQDFEDIICETPEVVIPAMEWLLGHPFMDSRIDQEVLKIVIIGGRERFFAGAHQSRVAAALATIFRESLPAEALRNARCFKSFFKLVQRAFCEKNLNHIVRRYRAP